MNTRNLLNLPLTFAALFFAYSAHAGDFSMGSSNLGTQMDHSSNTQSAQLDTSDDPIEINSRSMRSSARDRMPSGAPDFGSANVDRDDESSRVRQTNGESNPPKRSTTSDSAPATSKARPSNRWQSLVPGAIR